MDFKIEPLANRVLVKFSEKESKSSGGIIIPKTAQEDVMTGTAIAVGPTVETVKVDDTVMFGKHTGTKIDEDHMMFIEPILVAVLKPKDK